MSTLPTSEEISWLFSSPGSVLAIAIWRSRDGWSLATRNCEMSPPNDSKSLIAPRTHQAGETPARNAVLLFEHRAEQFRIEQAERAFEHGAEFVTSLEHVDGMDFHQRLEAFGERGFSAADRSEQIENLLALFESLRRVTEEPDDALDRVFHSVEAGESRIEPHRAIQKDTAKAWVLGRINHLRLADCG